MLKRGLPLAVVVLVLDQITKWLILAEMRPPGVEVTPFFTARHIEIMPFFDFVLTWNRGVSFGLFNQESAYGPLLLIALSLVITAVLVVWLARTDDRLLAVALGLIVGGALGNVIDRALYGAVVDFVLFYVGDWRFPAFNVADSAITIGGAILVFDALFGHRFAAREEETR